MKGIYRMDLEGHNCCTLDVEAQSYSRYDQIKQRTHSEGLEGCKLFSSLSTDEKNALVSHSGYFLFVND